MPHELDDDDRLLAALADALAYGARDGHGLRSDLARAAHPAYQPGASLADMTTFASAVHWVVLQSLLSQTQSSVLAVNILAYPELFPPEIVDLARRHASSAHDQ
jgi:hypothetical protein